MTSDRLDFSFLAPVCTFFMLALLPRLGVAQNHPNGVDFIIEGLPYADFTYAGVPGGIPDNPPGRVYNVQDYPGTDREKVQAAVNAAEVAGMGIVFLPEGTYRFDDRVEIRGNNIVIRGAGQEKTKVILENAKINEHETGAFSFFGGGRPKDTRFIVSDVEKGDRVLELADASRFAAGDFISLMINSDDMLKTNPFYRKRFLSYGEDKDWNQSHVSVQRIEAVDGNFITLTQPFRVSFKASGHRNAALGSFVRPVKLIRHCGVEKMMIKTEKFSSHKMNTSGVVFDWAYGCWVRDVTVNWAGSHPVNFRHAKNIEGRNITANNAYNLGGGGNGYFVLWGTSDGLMENIRADRLRHAPNFQGNANGCVFRNSTFTRQDGEWHGGYTVENMFENVSIYKDASRETSGLNALASNMLDDPYGGHQPHLHGQVVYNCELEIARQGCPALRLGGLHDGWIFAYNTIKNRNGRSTIWIGDYARGLVFKGNKIVMEDHKGYKAEHHPGGWYPKGNPEHAVMFTKKGWNTDTQKYDPELDTHYESITFEDNTFIGLPADRIWGGVSENVKTALTRKNNTVVTTYRDPVRPKPAIPSILDYQRKMKKNQPKVEITQPSRILQMNSFTVQVVADAENTTYGTLAKVVFYEGDTKLGEDEEAPYTCDVNAGGINRFMRLRAEAVYDSEKFYARKEIKVQPPNVVPAPQPSN